MVIKLEIFGALGLAKLFFLTHPLVETVLRSRWF